MSKPDGYTVDDVEHLLREILIPDFETRKFDFSEFDNFVFVSLYASCLELAHASILMIRVYLGYHCYSLLRSFIVNVVEMQNLHSGKTKSIDFQLNLQCSVAKTLKLAESGNPYFRSIAEMPEFKRNLKETNRNINEWKEKGARIIPDEQKFLRSGNPSEYALYRYFSDHLHGGTSAFISRHVELGTTQNEYTTKAFNHGEPKDFEAATTTLYEKLLEASEIVKQHSMNARANTHE